jgi:hypothetical protein
MRIALLLLTCIPLLRFILPANCTSKAAARGLESHCNMKDCAGSLQRRRGTRVRAQIPVRITSLDPATKFSENCHTVVVNPQGCGVRFSHSLEPGTQVRVDDLPGGGSATAHVASSLPLQTSSKYWLVGICLEQPANWWYLAPTPQDWDQFAPVSRYTPASVRN